MADDFVLTADVRADPQSLNRMGEEINRAVNRSARLNLNVSGEQPLGRLTARVSEFDKSIEAANARVVAFGASASVIGAVATAIHSMVTESINVQKALADINVLLERNDKSLTQFGNDLFEIAKQTGSAFSDAAKAATEFSRQGLSAEETLKRTRDALILTRLSGLELSRSVDTLTASVNSFRREGLSTTDVINKMATVDANFAVSSKDLAEAVSRAGSAVQDAGNNFDEFISLVTAAQEKTARGGAVIGNAFKSIFTRESRSKTLEQLEQMGIAVKDLSGNALPAITILQNLAKQYDNLTPSAKSFVTELVGGVFQVNILKASLSDLEKVNGTYARARQVAANADESAINRNKELNKTLAALANATEQNFIKISASAGKLVLGPTLEKIFGSFNNITDSLTSNGNNKDTGLSFGKKLGEGILRGIGEAISGPGLILGGTLAVKLLGQFAEFSVKSLSSILRLNKESRTVEVTQEGINELLKKDSDLRAKIADTTVSQSEKERLIVQALREELDYNKELLAIRTKLASFANSQGFYFDKFDRSLKGPTTEKAQGYIPQSQIPPESVLKEVEGARRVGYSINPNQVRAMRTMINGKMSTVVYNDREQVINDFGGSGEPAIIPPTMMNAAGGINIGGFGFSGEAGLPQPIESYQTFRKYIESAAKFGSEYLGVKPKTFAPTTFHPSEADDIRGAYFGGEHHIRLYPSNIVRPGEGPGVSARSIGEVAAHEIGHSFYSSHPEEFSRLLQKFGPANIQIPKNKKDALKYLEGVYALSPERLRELYKGIEMEEVLVHQFPNFLRAGFFAGGRLPNRVEYSPEGTPLGYAEFKKQKNALILDMVGTYKGADGNRQKGTGILSFAFKELLQRARKQGIPMIGFTPINGRVIQKAQSLFGETDSLGRPIDFGNNVRLKVDSFPEVFAAEGYTPEELSLAGKDKAALLRLANTLGISDPRLKKANSSVAKAIISSSKQYRSLVRRFASRPDYDPYEGATRFRLATGRGTSAEKFYAKKPILRDDGANVRAALAQEQEVIGQSQAYQSSAIIDQVLRDELAASRINEQDSILSSASEDALTRAGLENDAHAQSIVTRRENNFNNARSQVAQRLRLEEARRLSAERIAAQRSGYRTAQVPTSGILSNVPTGRSFGPGSVSSNSGFNLNPFSKLSEAQRGRFGQAAFGASFALPIAGGVTQEFVSSPVNKRRVGDVFNAVGSGLSTGALFGPEGAAIGAIAGLGVGIYNARNERETSQDLLDRARTRAEAREANVIGAKNFASLRGDIDEAVASGNSTRLGSLYRQLSTTAGSITDTGLRRRLLSASTPDQLNDILSKVNEQEDKTKARDDFSVNLRSFNEKFRKFGGGIQVNDESNAALKSLANSFVNAGFDNNNLPTSLKNQLRKDFGGNKAIEDSFKGLVDEIKNSREEFKKLAEAQKGVNQSLINARQAFDRLSQFTGLRRAVNEGQGRARSELAEFDLTRAISFESPFLTGAGLARSNFLLGQNRNRRDLTANLQSFASEANATIQESIKDPRIASTKEAHDITQALASNNPEQIPDLLERTAKLLEDNKQVSSQGLNSLREKLASIDINSKTQQAILEKTYQWEIRNLSRENLGRFLGGNPFNLGSLDTSGITRGTQAEIAGLEIGRNRFSRFGIQFSGGNITPFQSVLSTVDNDALAIRGARESGGVLGEARQREALRQQQASLLRDRAQRTIQEVGLGLLPEEATFTGAGLAVPTGLAARRTQKRNELQVSAQEELRSKVLSVLQDQVNTILPSADVFGNNADIVRAASISGSSSDIQRAISVIQNTRNQSGDRDRSAERRLLIEQFQNAQSSLSLVPGAAQVFANKAIANEDPTKLIKETNDILNRSTTSELAELSAISASAAHIVDGISTSNEILKALTENSQLEGQVANKTQQSNSLLAKTKDAEGKFITLSTEAQANETRANIFSDRNAVFKGIKGIEGLSETQAGSAANTIAAFAGRGKDSSYIRSALLSILGDENVVNQIFSTGIDSGNGIAQLGKIDTYRKNFNSADKQAREQLDIKYSSQRQYESVSKELEALNGRRPQVAADVTRAFRRSAEVSATNAYDNFNATAQSRSFFPTAPVSEQQAALARLSANRNAFAAATTQDGRKRTTEEENTLKQQNEILRKLATDIAAAVGKSSREQALQENPGGKLHLTSDNSFAITINGHEQIVANAEEAGQKLKEEFERKIQQIWDYVEKGIKPAPAVAATK